MEYEKVLMEREIKTLLPHAKTVLVNNEWRLDNLRSEDARQLPKLTFILEYEVDGNTQKTYQGFVEQTGCQTSSKQATRYSTHGIHEYKGKFNPQIVHYMVNMFGLDGRCKVLDPFNGSGTTTLECAHLGVKAAGADINPMACFIANAKVNTLAIDIDDAMRKVKPFLRTITEDAQRLLPVDNERIAYLRSWIPQETLNILEHISQFAESQKRPLANLLLTVASDMIREYSFQEPCDLRIRRRKSPMPTLPFLDVFGSKVVDVLTKITAVRQAIGKTAVTRNVAHCCDIRCDNPFGATKFDAVLTSPPYATALPYIDTQRISLVWLKLCSPHSIRNLETSLIGSRELSGSAREMIRKSLENNEENLPRELLLLVGDLTKAVSSTDGFRRREVPFLLYRYLVDMKRMFANVAKMVKTDAPFALVVGHNRTTLGGTLFYIDTPYLLSKIAQTCGWRHEETIPLETYRRYGLNKQNAIVKESMVILRRSGL